MKRRVTNEIRGSNLLANHSGLSEVAEDIWYGTGYDREELIERLAEVPITEGFRYRFQYRNVMFLAAGQLVPRVIGASWDDYIEDQQLVCRRTPSTILDLRCEQANTFLGEYRGVAEDLREGKLEITFQADAGRITGLSEGDLVFQAVDADQARKSGLPALDISSHGRDRTG